MKTLKRLVLIGCIVVDVFVLTAAKNEASIMFATIGLAGCVAALVFDD